MTRTLATRNQRVVEQGNRNPASLETNAGLLATQSGKAHVMVQASIPEVHSVVTPEVISRKQAKASGLNVYFSDKACCRGHFAARLVSDKKCIECTNIRSLEHYYRNHARVREKQKAYYHANRERIKAKADIYAAEHRQEAVKRVAEWRKANPERKRAQHTKRKAALKNATGHHTGEQLRAMLVAQKQKCINCKKSLKPGYHVDHIQPLCAGGSNDIANIQLLCPPCNMRKNKRDPVEWAQSNGRLL